jgi:hypothetical protein
MPVMGRERDMMSYPTELKTEETSLTRSPELLSRRRSGLLIVDVQEKLLPAIVQREQLQWNLRRLLDGAALLNVLCGGTEQYPEGLGPTVPSLAKRLGDLPAKRRFSAYGCGTWPQPWVERGIHQVVVAGIEAHVCVLQTAMDLLSSGFQVHVVVDAIASRRPLDYETALRRMENQGAILTTVEMVLFEWCETAADPQFKKISGLVREAPPTEVC